MGNYIEFRKRMIHTGVEKSAEDLKGAADMINKLHVMMMMGDDIQEQLNSILEISRLVNHSIGRLEGVGTDVNAI